MHKTLLAVLGLSSYAFARPNWVWGDDEPVVTTSYGCNPAHLYPGGASCIETEGSLSLVTPTSDPTSTDCNTAVVSDYTKGSSTLVTPTASATTTYGCNPAHAYPNGASCISTNGSLTLVSPTTSSMPTYLCNPAHSYPNNATCTAVSGSLTLVTVTPTPSARTTYNCNPAHSYPNGATCTAVSGSLTLVTPTTAAWKNNMTTEIVSSFVTYCPKPTHLTYNDKTYTVKSATTLTITDCPCTVSARYTPPMVTPTVPNSKPWWSKEASSSTTKCDNSTTLEPPTTRPYMPTQKFTEATTAYVTEYTTYCPKPTTLTYGNQTYTVTKASTLTVPFTHTVASATNRSTPYTTPIVSTTLLQPTTIPYKPTQNVSSMVTAYTTYCPSATTLTYGNQTFIVTKATSLTIPGTITATSQVAQPTVYTSKPVTVPTTAASQSSSASTSTLTAQTTLIKPAYSTEVITSQRPNSSPASSQSVVTVSKGTTFVTSTVVPSSSGLFMPSSPASVPQSSPASSEPTSSQPTSPKTVPAYTLPVGWAPSKSSSVVVLSSIASSAVSSASQPSVPAVGPSSVPVVGSSSVPNVYESGSQSLEVPASSTPVVYASSTPGVYTPGIYASSTRGATKSQTVGSATGTAVRPATDVPSASGAATRPMATGGVMVGAMAFLALF